MATIREGSLSASPYRFAIAVSRFNEFITSRLLDSAVDCLKRHGAREDSIEVAYCPGAFEIPQLARQLAATGRYSAVICLGCVIRGETPHFEYVAQAAATGIEHAALDTRVPIVFGVLTTDSLQQAIDRAGGKSGNKGWDAAMAAIEMADLGKTLSPNKE